MNSGDNIIKKKSFTFAVRIVNLYKVLSSEIKEFVMSKQLLRSGTSVGANIREALNAQSKPGFIHKLAISQKECDETGYTNNVEFESMNTDAIELLKIVRSIIMTSKKNIIHNS
ncbi:four helix bundle protein [Cytophaga hutchinsonii]|uniref:Four helix bundle protein n=1 Tax=Cytophaga hutchinsonii (strain ATCC 33406 / DSM 1761 / CIP 103989 / NBRC 15051 / NCIMB 9469 / D465) TaxID=269798 RepID=A0A6N4SSU1_CYTH3|nr:four helix bundle protein [Cytophaga hutchinsonii]ABG59504.1 conserved hypothetical protein [Cytophaga hutchinsonii ATCC 33406]